MFQKSIHWLLIVCITSCSALTPATDTITVTTDPLEAEIYINGNRQGVGTASAEVPRNASVQIMARLEGYETVHRTIGYQLGAQAYLDIVGGIIWLVPFIGLAAPGKYNLEEKNVMISLPKELAR